ncbi:hypothetical protein FK216_15575 [Moraxellaceae bacterium AER2_44_116]|nr:hypothetical protein FK216_15575 [Moraxellaceae bacterium AER2_44_116]
MKFTLSKPCANCPFRTDKPEQEGWLGGERAQEIADDICNGNKTFSCHKTVEHDEDGQAVNRMTEIHCAGALIMLEKMGMTNENNMLRIAQRLHLYDVSTLDMDSPIFGDESAFVDWHEGGVT